MERSESIQSIAKALVKFNGEVSRIEKDETNPHFKKKYATIDNIIDEIRPVLSKNGLAVMQIPATNGAMVTMQTMILHESGEWIMSPVFSMTPERGTPQGIGSVVTYLRRYSLNSFLSLNTGDEDDDGNEASGRTDERPTGRSNAQTPTQNRPNEQAERPRQQQSTQQRPPAQAQQRPNGGNVASPAQIKAIQSIGKSKGIQNGNDLARLGFIPEGRTLETLSRTEASHVIDSLNAYVPHSQQSDIYDGDPFAGAEDIQLDDLPF